MSSSSPDELHAFGDSAQALEAQIAEAEARGAPVPPEARAMLESLRAWLARELPEQGPVLVRCPKCAP